MGIVFGSPRFVKPETKKTSTGKYFVKAWWTDLNDNKITEALLEDTVKFHLETKDIPEGQPIFISLFEDDRRIKLDEDKENDKINLVNSKTGKPSLFQRIYGNKLVKTITLSNLDSFIKNETDGILELFFACSYKNDHDDLPHETSDYLKVKGMPKIIIVNGQWRIAHYTIGEIIPVGPTEPKKPYWVEGIANNARDYFDSQFNLKDKFTLNKNKFNIEELEKSDYILYYDGSSNAAVDQSGADRFNNGRKFVEDNYKEIIKGLGKEAVYLVSHSEGGAYASGMADFLFEKGHTIGEHILLSPDEGDEFEINPAIPSYQLLYMFFSSIYNPILIDVKYAKFKKWDNYYAVVDWVVNEHKIKGITKMGIVHNQEAGWTGVHGWTNGYNIFDKVSDLKEVSTFLVQGEHRRKFYSGHKQTDTPKKTKFYRINDEYIVTNCPPLIEIK
jgi:hypothetical protein